MKLLKLTPFPSKLPLSNSLLVIFFEGKNSKKNISRLNVSLVDANARFSVPCIIKIMKHESFICVWSQYRYWFTAFSKKTGAQRSSRVESRCRNTIFHHKTSGWWTFFFLLLVLSHSTFPSRTFSWACNSFLTSWIADAAGCWLIVERREKLHKIKCCGKLFDKLHCSPCTPWHDALLLNIFFFFFSFFVVIFFVCIEFKSICIIAINFHSFASLNFFINFKLDGQFYWSSCCGGGWKNCLQRCQKWWSFSLNSNEKLFFFFCSWHHHKKGALDSFFDDKFSIHHVSINSIPVDKISERGEEFLFYIFFWLIVFQQFSFHLFFDPSSPCWWCYC